MRSFVLVLVAVLLPGAAVSAEMPPELRSTLMQLDSLLDLPHPDPIRLQAIAGRLGHPGEGRGGAYADLERRLAAQVEALARHVAEPEPRATLTGEVRTTLEQLRAKAERPTPADRLFLAQLAPSNDTCANAIAVSGAVTGSTAEASNDGSASCGGSETSPDVWYTYAADDDGFAVFDTAGSALDTVISLHSACPDAGGDHELACRDDSRGTLASKVGHPVGAGETIWVRVAGAGGAVGGFELDVRDDPGGAITGQVRKQASGEPLADVQVQVHRPGAYYAYDYEYTDAEGRYTVYELPADSYRVVARHALFVDEVWNDQVCHNCEVATTGDPIPVDDDLVEDVDFDLLAGASFSGTVTTASAGYRFIDVFAYDSSGEFLASTYTGGSEYTLGGLPPGSVTAVARSYDSVDVVWPDLPCGRSCDVTAGDPIELTAGSNVEGIDFYLPDLGSISGQVLEASGSAPDSSSSFDPMVTALYPDGSYAESTYRFGAGGEYMIDGLSPGDYHVVVGGHEYINEVYDDLPCTPSCPYEVATAVSVSVATDTPGIDFQIDRLGRIEGTVADLETGAAVQHEMLLYDAAGQLYYPDDESYATGYRVYALAPGDYFLRVRPYNFYYQTGYESVLYDDVGCSPDCTPTDGQPIHVDLNTTVVGIDFELDRCSTQSHVTLNGLTVAGDASYEACRTLHAGNVDVQGDLSLAARRSVSFGDGFRVRSGGSLEVTVSSEIARDPTDD